MGREKREKGEKRPMRKRKRKRRDNRERNCENRSPIEISIAFRPRNVNFRVELLLVIHPVIKTRGYLLHAKRHGERGMKVAGEGKRRENTGCTQREKLHREQKPVVTGRFNYIYLPKMTRLRRRGFVLAETRFFSPLLVFVKFYKNRPFGLSAS